MNSESDFSDECTCDCEGDVMCDLRPLGARGRCSTPSVVSEAIGQQDCPLTSITCGDHLEGVSEKKEEALLESPASPDESASEEDIAESPVSPDECFDEEDTKRPTCPYVYLSGDRCCRRGADGWVKRCNFCLADANDMNRPDSKLNVSPSLTPDHSELETVPEASTQESTKVVRFDGVLNNNSEPAVVEEERDYLETPLSKTPEENCDEASSEDIDH